MNQRNITKDEFNKAVEAIWTEIEYRNSLDRRTEDEAKDVPGYLTLIDRYRRLTADKWSDSPGTLQEDKKYQVEEALHGLRKIAGIAICSMIYCGIKKRKTMMTYEKIKEEIKLRGNNGVYAIVLTNKEVSKETLIRLEKDGYSIHWDEPANETEEVVISYMGIRLSPVHYLEKFS